MGFGHRVYKNFDPRALVMQESCHAVLAEQGVEDEPLLKIATMLEKMAREEPYFIERKLYPNIDFYSGITLKAMGIPTPMYTALFALEEHRHGSRTGLCFPRHLRLVDPDSRGPAERAFAPLNERA